MMKGKVTSRPTSQQAIFQLKHRVVLALNKLADRDTYQIGVEELEKTVEGLTPDGVAPFMSCILDTDSEQKSAVRKECIRLMGTMATFHEVLVGPHLSKIITSIVKRLKDSDSVVRDACIETVGVLASKMSSSRFEMDGVFTVLVRPLFEALGEQNKLVQSGSALCLSRVIENIHDPPPMILQKMLSRTVKLLKNNHFMAKPAVIDLNKSIILAGGAPTHSSLTAALASIQDNLKNTDWATRKAACLALGEIASCGAACLSSFRTSCIRCLESCRFDKVKPVRDVALQALQLWRNLPGPNTPEPSETGSSVKETFSKDYGDITSTSDSTMKDITMMQSEMANKRVPFSSKRPGKSYSEKSQKSGVNDWQIEFAVPNNHSVSVDQNDESEGSSVTKRCEKISVGVRNVKNIGYDYVEMADKQECSSVSNIFSESMKPSVVSVTAYSDAFDNTSLVKSTGTSQLFVADEVSIEEQRYLSKIPDRLSLDSTVTESVPSSMRVSYSQTEKDLVLIKKQLLEIESKQSNLMDMLKAFTTTIMDSMSMVQSKVSNLELIVDKLGQEIVHGGKYSNVLATKLVKRSPSTASPRLSTCSPRTSVHSNRQPPLLPTKIAGVLEENAFTGSRSSSFGRQNSDMWADATLKINKSSFGNRSRASFCPEIHENKNRKNENVSNLVPTTARVNKLGTKNSQWTVMKDHFSDGDLDSAYKEALCSRNELLLFELLGRTGPVLENLSERTASDLLSTLASYLLEQRFMSSIIPWLQQLVDLSNIHGPNYLVLSAKAKRDFLVAIQEAAKLDAFSTSDRRFFVQLGKSLRQNWGNGPF